MERYDILVGEEFSCLEFHMDRDTISWILKIEYRRSLMEKLPKYKHENGIDYVLAGDYYIPMLALPEESRPIGRWGRRTNSIRNRAEEIIRAELIYV